MPMMMVCPMHGKHCMVFNPNDATDAWAINDDNVLNLFEYQLGGIPNDPASPVTVDVNAGGMLPNAIDNANPGELIRITQAHD